MLSIRSVILIIISILLSYGVNNLIQYQQQQSEMFNTWKLANNALNLSGKHVLVVGGTQGIGSGVAIRFSQLGSSVAIAGRNESLANEVISKMKSESKTASQDFRFFKLDASLLADVERFTKETIQYYESRGSGIDYLIQSQGLIHGPLALTSEGHDRTFMINGYSKWFITNKLQSLLKESSIYIFAPTKHGSIDFDDVELKNSSRFPGTPGNRDGVFLDAITKEFQSRYPSKRFYHMFPGLVNTDILKNSSTFIIFLTNIPDANPLLSMLHPLLKYFAVTVETFADLPVFIATQDKNGGISLNEKGKPDFWLKKRTQCKLDFIYNIKAITPYDWITNPENRAKLWAWNENLAAHSRNG